MNNGTCGGNITLFGYPTDIEPIEMDTMRVRFESDTGRAICFYRGGRGTGEKLIHKLNSAFPNQYFEKISDIVNYQINKDWTERQILQQVLAVICGIEVILNEDGLSFAQRVEPYEQRWKRQQC